MSPAGRDGALRIGPEDEVDGRLRLPVDAVHRELESREDGAAEEIGRAGAA